MPGKYTFPDTPKTIWDQPDLGMDKDQFYASVYAVEVQQFQQREKVDQLPSNDRNKTISHFLDRLALLFANHKKSSKNTPKHVTATGFVKESWTIYIAKNDGLTKPDEDLARDLEDWLNDKIEDCNEPGVHNKVWGKMVAHWAERIEYYASAITKFCANEGPRKEKLQKNLEGDEEQLKAFLEGWEKAEMFANDAAKLMLHHADEEAMEILESFYYFWKDGGKSDFPHLDKATGFDKFISHMEMLGMLHSMWYAFLEFRRYKGRYAIQFMIIERCSKSNLPKENIQRTIQQWKTERPGIDVSVPEQRLKDMRSPPELYFHCELQICLVFHYLRKGHDFIGCSKLSCELCWCILNGGKYNTRGSHHKLSTNCAFPFPNDLTDIAARMKLVHERYKGKIFNKTADSYEKYPRLVDTRPGRTEVLVDDIYAQAMVKQLALRDCSEYPKGQGLYGPYKADKGMKTFKGGFALVHQVVKQTQDFNDPQADQQAFYALKEIRIRDKHQCELVHREVEILKKVNHSNILALEEAFYVSDPRIIFLATQPWAPLSLEILLRNALEEKFEPWHNSGKSWPWQSIISQCIRGVGYLHTELSKPIKHKDLKPQNILLHVEGHLVRPIIADFGLSKEWENGCPTDNSGTAQFKAPEQLQHDDSKLESDIWALGCCFSLILSLLNESNISLLELWEIGVGPVKTPSRDQESNPGFFNNLDKIIKILGRTCGSSFADLFRRLILEMLLSEPKHRPNARDLDIQFVQLFHLPNLLLSWLYIGEKGGQIWRNNPHLQF